MGARSRNKGARCEREVCALFAQRFGGAWSRVPLSGGWGNRAAFATCGDVITTLADFPFTIECKNAEGWRLEHLLTRPPETCILAAWWHQACTEAEEAGKQPLLVFTRNFQPLFAMVPEDALAPGGPEKDRQILGVRLGGVRLAIGLLEEICDRLMPGSPAPVLSTDTPPAGCNSADRAGDGLHSG